VPESTLYVTTDSIITMRSGFVGVAPGGILVPSGAGTDMVCGDDIALLILDAPIMLPGGYPNGYVMPAISPPLTDPSRSTTITAIGYGIDTPTDDSGASAGTRRIKENVSLACIPNDPNFVDCFTDPQATQYLTAAEFVSGDETTCEGDSGSGVYDQTQFDAGKWVSYGVLSRGSVSTDGQNCVEPIYTRFDHWGPLLSQAAATATAASKGLYGLPSWATGVSLPVDAATIPPPSDAGQGAAPDGATSGGSSSGAATTVGDNGTTCNTSSQCNSGNCVAFDGTHYYCAIPCTSANACPDTFACEGPAGGNFCFPASSVSPASGGGRSGGCAVATMPSRRNGAHDLDGGGTLIAALAVLAGRVGRRRRACGPSPAVGMLTAALSPSARRLACSPGKPHFSG
jgi:hypothetical protein